jgi:hypothetical protein
MVVVGGLVDPNDFLDAFEQNVKDGVNYLLRLQLHQLNRRHHHHPFALFHNRPLCV